MKITYGLVKNYSLAIHAEWKNNEEQIIFFEPSIKNHGSSIALIKSREFLTWLENNDLQLIWLIGGEFLFSHSSNKFYGRLIYSGIYKLTKTGISKNIWFIKQMLDQ